MSDAILGASSSRWGAALLGFKVGGELGRILRVAEACALCVGAWGLWNLRAWARVAAMGYLALVILSFLFLGVGGGRDRAAWTMLWQITIVPFATFCYMFLHGGRRYFKTASPTPILR
jgi:hypothetical protein